MALKVKPWVHKNYVSLKQHKNDNQKMICPNTGISTRRFYFMFKKYQEFNQEIRKGSNSKYQCSISDTDTSMTFVIFNQRQFIRVPEKQKSEEMLKKFFSWKSSNFHNMYRYFFYRIMSSKTQTQRKCIVCRNCKLSIQFKIE